MKRNILLSTVFSLAIATSAMAEEVVIATVNGQPVYKSEMDRNLKQIPNFDELPTEQQKIIKDKILKAVTKLQAVVQEAEKLKVQDSDTFKNQMADFRKQLMYSNLLESHLESVITDTKLKEHYDENKKDYIEDKAKASHILVSTKKEADEIIQKLTAGAEFAALANEYSIGPSSSDGGNLGWFTKDTMVPEFSEATFNLEKGAFTKQAVQTQFGWHIIMLEDKTENTPALFEDIKEQIKETLMKQEVESYLDNIINKADIVINDDE